MYNLDEIKLQNQQDCLSKMYMELAGSIYECTGKKAEGIIREAVRRYGADRGKELKEKHLNNGIKTNLLSLFTESCECSNDPRFRKNIIEQNEQVRLWEIYTCPMADLWNKDGKSKLGSFYCEECTHALINAYTDAKGQTNLSNILTCERDNFCRFSVYFRPANLSEEKRKLCFGDTDNTGIASKDEEKNNSDTTNNQYKASTNEEFKKDINAMFIKLYYYLLEVSQERLADEGVCAIALGLRNLTKIILGSIIIQAENTGNIVNKEFIYKNFPLNIDSENELLWEKYNKNDAKKLIDNNFLIPLKKQLNIGI